ncbi:helix-turn-helix domain-containing protein [Aureimonas sp. N4]|uniref:helix-turn-helix domain-containing protein n=1 Tax=Aureimonas sp. N4 TaxID=1638165 RepID=UPI0007820640|nr:helix-turn-helix transcriptional regulator [Aureimonas sp. N4]
MTSDDFKAWRTMMGYSQAKAAEELGISKPTVENYERGQRREDGRPVEIPRSIALACSAVYHRLDPWDARMSGVDG